MKFIIKHVSKTKVLRYTYTKPLTYTYFDDDINEFILEIDSLENLVELCDSRNITIYKIVIGCGEYYVVEIYDN